MPSIYNCHVHIFNVRCAPDKFLGVSLGKFLNNMPFTFWLSKFFKYIIPSERDFLEKYGNFIAIGSKKSQESLFEYLKYECDYALDTRFVVLAIDMDFMGAGKAYVPYLTQIDQVREAKIKYKNELLPFIGVDPRRGDANYLYRFVKKHIEETGFFHGIKLYPALGFYPFDEKLKDVYAYAEQKQIPIMTHCTKGGIFYRGKEFTNEQLKPTNLNPNPIYQHDYTLYRNTSNSNFKNHFSHPRNYEEVLMVFPKLKICIAHYGGSDEIKAYKNNQGIQNWYTHIKSLLTRFENVYTDISYTLSENTIFPILVEDIKNDQLLKLNPDKPTFKLQDKILFGTDFYMTIQEKSSERQLVDDFRNAPGLTINDFDRISNGNVRRYLESGFLKL